MSTNNYTLRILHLYYIMDIRRRFDEQHRKNIIKYSYILHGDSYIQTLLLLFYYGIIMEGWIEGGGAKYFFTF